MVKSELVLRLAARFKHLVQQDAEIAVNLIVGAMLAHGRRVGLREFGSLHYVNARLVKLVIHGLVNPYTFQPRPEYIFGQQAIWDGSLGS